MRQALRCARRAAEEGEVPVGAVVMHEGQIVGAGHNTPISDHDPSAHAEINALRQAAARLGNYRLDACTLYVTLEPCIMCAGAILNARVGRVVFAAHDLRAGAAGSVVDLFADPRLNHQTRVEAGLLAEPARALLQEFFQARRTSKAHPLREDALRTPDAAFSSLPDYPWPPHYLQDLPALGSLRLHYVDTGPRGDARRAWLLLHGAPFWSYAYRHMIAAVAASGQRVVAPDLPGFGKSDKPKRARAQGRAGYVQILRELVAYLDLQQVILVGQGLGSQLALQLLHDAPSRYAAALFLDRQPATDEGAGKGACPAHDAAWAAPFPNKGFRAAIQGIASLPGEAPGWPHPWPGRVLAVDLDTGNRPMIRLLALDAIGTLDIWTAAACKELPAWLHDAGLTAAVVAHALSLLENQAAKPTSSPRTP